MAPIDKENRSPMIARILGSTGKPGNPGGAQQAPASAPAQPSQGPTPDQGNRPPVQPPIQYGGSGGGGGSFGGVPRWLLGLFLCLVLVLALYIAITVIGLWATKKNIELIKEVDTLSQNSSSPPAQPAPQNQPKTMNIANGAEVTLPLNAQVILHGPMTATFIDSTATRIKGFTGDFKLHIEGSENWAWTPGFSSEASPMLPSDFLGHLRRILAKKPNQVKVKIFINNGVVELNT